MTDAFDEVEEEVRRERYTQLIKKYGPWALGALGAVLVAVAGWQIFTAWQDGELRGASKRFIAAQYDARADDQKKRKTAEANFRDLAESAPGIYRELAEMELAGLQAERGDLRGATKAFDAIAEETSDPILRNTARMRAAYLAADTENLAAMRRRLDPIIEEGGSFAYLARELLAHEAWEAKDYGLARTMIAPVMLAPDTPESVRQRAKRLSDALAGLTSQDTQAQAEDAPASRGEKK